MGRRGKHDKHLPQRVYHRGKRYYFVDHEDKWHRLGVTIAEIYGAHAEMLEEPPIVTMNDLLIAIWPKPCRGNRNARSATVDGFNTIFYRAMAKAIADARNPLTERFQFRDLWGALRQIGLR